MWTPICSSKYRYVVQVRVQTYPVQGLSRVGLEPEGYSKIESIDLGSCLIINPFHMYTFMLFCPLVPYVSMVYHASHSICRASCFIQ
jgi:hypothetical protein